MSLRIVGLLVLVVAALPGVRANDVSPGLYLRTTYAFNNLALNTIFVGPGNTIAIDPKGGTDAFDFAAAAKTAPDKVGTFKIDGAKIIVTWANKKTDSLDVEFTKGSLSAYDGGLVSKADAYPKEGKTMTATFAGSAQTQNVSSTLTLALTADGKYTMTGLGGVRGTAGGTGVSEKTVTGTYTLKGNTMELKASTGETTKHTVMPFNTALDPKTAKITNEHLIFDGANLKREK